jgi:pentatricopeptide repeat protein
MNVRTFLSISSSSSLRRKYLLKPRIIFCDYYYYYYHVDFNKIKSLYNEGKEQEAIHEYFKKPNSFAASFLIARQKKIDMALKIYQTAKNSSSLDFLVIRTLINVLEKRKEHHLIIDTVFDDSMIEIQKMQVKDIAKIKATDWTSILKSLFNKRRKNDVIKVMDLLQKSIENNGKIDIALKNYLINIYGKYGYLEEAIKIFNNIKISERNIITWTSMITAYGEHRNGEEALQLFWKMQEEGIKPDDKIVTCILKACCESGLIDNAVDILFSMEKKLGLKPDRYHYSCLLTACADNRLLPLGEKIHKHIIESKQNEDVILKTNIINMYGKCGNLEEALRLFNDIKSSESNIITWTTMILAYGEHGKGREALALYEEMQKKGYKPDDQTIACVLKACCESGLIDNASEIFFSMEKKLNIKPDEYHYNCMLTACADNGLLSLGKMIHKHMIDKNHLQSIILKNNLINMYGKCGSLEEAIKIFDDIDVNDRNVITWSTMILTYGQHGRGKEAISLFEKMQQKGLSPDETTVTRVLNACSHSGLVREALDIFCDLESKFNVKVDVFHCACIVDLLGRAGRLEEAERFIVHYMKEQQIEADIPTWMGLLGACRTYKDVERAERVAQHILDLDPKDASVYVLLSNIYAQSGNMNKAEDLRVLMDKKGIKKIPGISTVEVNGKIYEFVSDDNSHANIKEIHSELQLLTEEMIIAGYNPDTSWVIRDVESEEEKKELLCRHSEKLAMAWAMINTPPGTAIRITKNLRVCGDCHNATKFISKIRKREIIVRDASRYHHFKDGKCSCGDYW